MQGDMPGPATRLRRAGPANLKTPGPAAQSRLETAFYSSFKLLGSATVRHGGPGCSAHPVRRNAMTHFNTYLAQPAKRMLARPAIHWLSGFFKFGSS